MLHREIEELRQSTSLRSGSEIQLLSGLISDQKMSLERLQVLREEMPMQSEMPIESSKRSLSGDKRYLDILEFSPDGYLVTDPSGIIQDSNKAASSLLNADRQLLLCKPMNIFVDKSDLKAFYDRIERLRSGEQVLAFEALLGSREGSKFMASVSAGPIFADGRLEGMLWHLRDITGQVQAEAALKRREKALREAYIDLERKIQERTEKLVEANCELMKSNEALQSEVVDHARAQRLLRLQRDLAIDINSARSMIESLGVILDAALEVDGIDCGGVYIIDESSGELGLTLYKGLSERFVESCSHYDADSFRAGMVRSGEWIYMGGRDLQGPPFRDLMEEGLRSLAALPMKYDGRVIACLNLASRTYDEIPLDARTALEALAASTAEIMARIKAEEELRESEERFKAIFETARDSIFIKDTSLQYTQVNPAMERLFCRPASELIGLTDIELFGFEAGSQVQRTDLRVLNGEVVEEEHTRPVNGAFRTFHVVKVPMSDGSGRITGLCGIARDITDRRLTDETVRRWSHIFENADWGVVFSSGDERKFEMVNPAYARMHRYSVEELIGEPITKVFPSDDWESLERHIQIAHERGHYIFEADHIRKDGSRFPAANDVTTLRDEDGRIMGRIVYVQDITERKIAEEMLLKAKEAAEAAAVAKTEFLATMSHEIRTPMNAVIGMTSILLEDGLTKEQRDCVETIRSSGDALLAIINDILDLSKIDREGAKREYQPLDLHECLKSSIELVASEASKKGLGLTCAVGEGVPGTILSDVNRLRQVLVNLIGNAVKFTEAGRILITASARNMESDLYEISFSIEDTGIGIPHESLGKLFLPFSQVDMSTTRRYGGTGLGLAISKRLVELMDGKIWAESSPGIGSIFHFTIRARCAEMEEQREVKDLPKSDRPARRAMHILLAEDSLVSQKMTMLMLHRLGYRADAVADGLEVLEALKRQQYDVILMDVQMPDMDGLEATRAIRRQWPLGPKIIAVTAYALEGDRERCIEAGMDGYLAKPIKMEELRSILESI